jgi:hypothetical protein
MPVLLVLWLAACAPQPPQQTQTSAAPPPAAAPATPNPPPASSEAQIAPGRGVSIMFAVRTCSAPLTMIAPPPRCSIRYLAAKAGIHVIDVGKIDENVGKVMKQCQAAPDITGHTCIPPSAPPAAFG